MASARNFSDSSKPKRPPAKTVEARENQLISLAVNLAEEQLRNGTASAQVVTHYLKLASVKEQKEREKLSLENELLKARTDNIKQASSSEENAKAALDALRGYRGEEVETYED